MDNDESLQDLISALMRLQALKIEREYEIAADAILMTFSFDAMCEFMEKRDEEVAKINAEIEKELKKYKTKS